MTKRQKERNNANKCPEKSITVRQYANIFCLSNNILLVRNHQQLQQHISCDFTVILPLNLCLCRDLGDNVTNEQSKLLFSSKANQSSEHIHIWSFNLGFLTMTMIKTQCFRTRTSGSFLFISFFRFNMNTIYMFYKTNGYFIVNMIVMKSNLSLVYQRYLW